MKNKLLLSTLSIALNFSTISFGTTDLISEIEQQKPTQDLLQGRPQEITKAVEDSFSKLKSRTIAYWCQNGDRNACFGKVDGADLLIHVLENNPDEKIFRILDLGSGMFQNIDYIVDALIENGKFYGYDKQKQIDIYGTRGEPIKSDDCKDKFKHGPFRSENCRLFREDCFIIEDLKRGLERIDQYFMINQFNIITSRFCFLHLVDPLGTLLQSYNHLRPGGFMIVDGFPIPFETDKKKNEVMYPTDTDTSAQRLIAFLNHMNIPFLFLYVKEESEAKFANVLIQKPMLNHEINNLPWQYTGTTNFNFGGGMAYVKAVYGTNTNVQDISLPLSYTISGDKKLYEIYKSIEAKSEMGREYPLTYEGSIKLKTKNTQ